LFFIFVLLCLKVYFVASELKPPISGSTIFGQPQATQGQQKSSGLPWFAEAVRKSPSCLAQPALNCDAMNDPKAYSLLI